MRLPVPNGQMTSLLLTMTLVDESFATNLEGSKKERSTPGIKNTKSKANKVISLQ